LNHEHRVPRTMDRFRRESMDRQGYPRAPKLAITADSDGANGARVRLCKSNCKSWSTRLNS
jgi:hypothetical protein